MGGSSGKPPRAVLHSPEQLSFKAARLKKEVADTLKTWFEEGAPLALSPELFQQVICDAGRSEGSNLFKIFDTDCNQKVDAFEALSASILLSEGSLEEKLEALFPVFDFSGDGKLNFDEANILVQSVSRGLTKVCELPAAPDAELVEACRLMFDAYNLPYDRHITREQIKRWLRSDIEATRFLDAFHRPVCLAEAETLSMEREREQAAAFAAIRAPVAGSLLSSDTFRQTLGNPSDEAFRQFVTALCGAGDETVVSAPRFAQAARAWNVFWLVDLGGEGELGAKDLPLLFWLRDGRRPEQATLEREVEVMGLGLDGRISRSLWLSASLRS